MIVIKRDGRREEFNKERISSAVQRSFKSVDGEVTDKAKLKSHEIANSIADQAADGITVEEIQDLVEKKLMNSQRKDVARAFITYRNERTRLRGNTIDKEIKDLVEDNSDYWKGENSNKNPMLNTTKRDYMAGIVSKDATERYLLPPEIVQAHKEGLIHFHDQDYFLQHSHNCDLVNLGDMLQNGTMISDTLIEKPHSFSTACNVATQIIAQVASSQYGGQSISAAQLSPFVDVSRQRIRNKLMEELAVASLECNENQIQAMIELRLRDEIKKGVQIIQYQVLTLMTTNGQAPFITVFLYLDEVHRYEDWPIYIKNIYDDYPELQVVFTGSSLLQILDARADLSRRPVMYNMQGLSFREFLNIKTGNDFQELPLEEILHNHSKHAFDICDKVKPFEYFGEYLKTGYYPFFLEGLDTYYMKLEETVNMILDVELPLLRKIEIAYVPKIKKLLAIIAESSPFVLNTSKLSGAMELNRTTLLSYLKSLTDAKLIDSLFKDLKGVSSLQKPDKIFLENTNLMYLYQGEKVDEGSRKTSPIRFEGICEILADAEGK